MTDATLCALHMAALHRTGIVSCCVGIMSCCAGITLCVALCAHHIMCACISLVGNCVMHCIVCMCLTGGGDAQEKLVPQKN